MNYMDLTDADTFCSARTRNYLQGFIASFKIGNEEIRTSCFHLIQTLKHEAEVHIQNGSLDKAEKCYSLSLKALETVTNDCGLAILSPRDLAILWCNRSFVRCKQRKFLEALQDAEICMDVDPNYIKGYWRSSQAQKALSRFGEAAAVLVFALSWNNLSDDDTVCFMSELTILVSHIKNMDELRNLQMLNIVLPTSLHIWTQIVKNLSENNEYEALSILTTGICDTNQRLQTKIHKSASIPGLSFEFLNVGEMLKILADKDGTRSWHLKLAEFAVQRRANIQTVAESFKQPFLVAMTALSVEGEMPSFLSLAWDKLSPEDYDQQDEQGNSPFHIVAKSAKFSKQSSEVICRALLAHGCLTTEADMAGRLPHIYVSAKCAIHKLLKSAIEIPDKGLLSRLEQIRKDGNKAYKNKEYDKAVKLYKKALAISLMFDALKKDAAVLHGNICAVYLKKETYEEALVFAENSIKADPDFCKGYYRKGIALENLDKHRDACEAFVLGFHKANEESMKYTISLAAAKIIHFIPDADSRFIREMKNILASSWPKIIENLTQNGLWVQVSSLVLGPPYDGSSTMKDRAGMMAKFDASRADLSKLFEAVEMTKIDAPAVVILLLSQGAQPASMASSLKKETYFHAAVRFCVCTNDARVLEFVLDNDRDMAVQFSKDYEDRTPLHTLCLEEAKNKTNSMLPVQMAQLLIGKKVDINAKDKYMRKALDYAMADLPLKEFMKAMASNPTGKKGQSPGTQNHSPWSELKEKGNKAYSNKDYEEAKQLYSQAINSLEEKKNLCLHGPLSEDDEHNLAVLYGNRAECWNKQGNVQMFLDDARKSVDADGSWFKGHWRVGRAFKELGKVKNAVRAFLNTLKSLPKQNGEEVACSVMSDLVEAVYDLNEGQISSVTILRQVSNELWPKVAYDFIKSDRWKLAEFIFTNSNNPPFKNFNVDLGQFCKRNLLDNQRWICRLLLWFLSAGADHKQLKFHDGDTYFHATITIILLSGSHPQTIGNKLVDSDATQLLNFIVSQKVYPNREVNIQDNKGNTVLHLLATSQGPDRMRDYLAFYLLDQGVDVMIENSDRKKAFELVSISDVIRLRFQDYMDKYKLIDKLKGQTRQAKNDSQNIKQTKRQENSSTKSESQSNQPFNSSTKNDSQNNQPFKRQGPKIEPQPDTQKKENPSKPANTGAHICERCERKMLSIVELNRKEHNQNVYTNLVDVINCKNNAAHHKELTERAVQQIASLLSQDVAQEVPQSVFKIGAKRFREVLTLLASAGKWMQMEMLVTKFKHKKGPYSLPDFAKQMSLLDLVSDRSPQNTEAVKLNLINLLTVHGATVDRSTSVSALKVAMEHAEWRVVGKLLDLKADPKGVTLSPGDTPYHAALQVALNRQPGNFSILHKLKHMEDSDNNPDLNVCCEDINGNTLFHAAAQAKFSQHSLNAVELLCKWNVPVDVRNNDGKLPIHYLSNDKDRRVQYLKRSGVSSSKDEGKNATESPGVNISREAGGARQKGFQHSGTGSSLPSVQALREDAEAVLLSLPEVTFNFLMPEDSKDVYDSEEEVEQDSEDDENDSDDAEINKEFEESSMELNAEYESDPNIEGLDIDVKAFDTLEWDIECTEDVWNALRSRKEKDQVKGNKDDSVQTKQRKERVPHNMKELIVKKIQQLASGDWTTYLQQNVPGTPSTLQLFLVPLPEGASILWELAVAFSPRLYDSEQSILEESQQTSKNTETKGNKVYSELIRIWSIVLKQTELQHVVHKIISSHERGKKCIIQKNLRLLNNAQFGQPAPAKHLPMLYIEQDLEPELTDGIPQAFQRMLFPPASNHKNEFHVLKFYSFSSSLVSAVLSETDSNVDFPFRVTDTEHSVINLESKSPLLLLGRSGTGKTTCCLYRMWSMFLHYWEQSTECNAALLPRKNLPPVIQEADGQQQENNVGEATAKSTEETKLSSASGKQAAASGFDHLDCLDDDSETEEHESETESGDESEEDSALQYDHLHQLFVTKNPVLCSEVQKNFLKLCRAATLLQQHNTNQRKNLPNIIQDVDDLSFPLFLTSRQLLLMLDASVDGEPFFPRDEDLALKVAIPGWGTQEDIFTFIPLEQDYNDGEENAGSFARSKHGQNRGARLELKDYSRRECTYEVFAYEVWPKISKKTEIDCHPSLVWTEIMSFIKGSYESLHTEKGYLSKEQYLELGHKRAPNFSGNRSQVYDTFLGYVHYKQQHSLFDEADLVYKVFCRLRTMSFQPWVLHEIYVDETQDFTQAELALLVLLCSDPNKMFLTGDTAQSIMRGISFRFTDLRSLFFHAKQSAKQSERHLTAIKVPKKIHQLTHNYRSHTGILSLASAVLDILLELFPDSFDQLEKDQGMFVGPRPILIESSSPGDLALLLSGSQRKTSHIEFGAHQAVLVVSERAKEQLPEELSTGIVLTIFESKGLEFDDVLIYNFFKDSQAKKEWRVVSDFLRKIAQTDTKHSNLDSLVEIDIDALTQSHKTRPLLFDPNLHKVLNSELKHLYTAITRARVNVWIFDEDDEKRAPMFEYFKARGLVKCMGTEECENINEAIMFADRSSSKEWKLAGDRYMHQKLYAVAAKCYRLAELPDKEKLALAYQTALEASRLRNTPRAMRDAYFKAGAQFVHCGDLFRAAACFQNAREFFLAALAFEKNGQFEDASIQYIRAMKINDASRCLEQIGMFGRAIRVLVDHELYDRAIDCHHRYKMELDNCKRPIPAILIENKPSDDHSEAHLCYRAANFHYDRGDLGKAIAAIKRSRSTENQILFLKEKGFWEEAATILRQEGKTEQAAQLMLKSGNTDKALEYAHEGSHKTLIASIYLVLARKYETVDNNPEMIKYNAMKALNMYIELEDINGQAQAKLILGTHTMNSKQIKDACSDFRHANPRNLAGELDCFIISCKIKPLINSLDNCNEFLKNIELGFQILDVLLNPRTDNIDKHQLFLSFYGMELDTVKHQVTWYPQQFPRCRDFMENKNEQTKAVTVDKAKAVIDLKNYLMNILDNWEKMVKLWLQDNTPSHLQCSKYQEGEPCSTNCKYMHKPYKAPLDEIKALEMLICSLRLDNYVQMGREKISEDVSNNSKWDSVKELLQFVFPSCSSALKHREHTLKIIKKLRSSEDFASKLVVQVQRYFRYLWDNPGRVGKGKSKDVIKERCKSTDWIVQACFFASLLKFHARLDVAAEVNKLENDLMTRNRNWAWKKRKYALFTSRSEEHGLLIEAVGTRFIQSFQLLTRSEPDPYEAIFAFTKMISSLAQRGQLALMPSLDHLVFWTEFYYCHTLFLIAKVTATAENKTSFYITKSFNNNLELVSACNESHSVTIQQLLAQHRTPSQLCTQHKVIQRQCFLANTLVGHHEFSNFSLISQAGRLCEEGEPNFLLAERIVILSALFLLNIPHEYVSSDYEVPIRTEIFKLPVTETMPRRLASLITSLKEASNYQHVAQAVLNCFTQQGCDGLWSCQWIGQNKQPIQFHEVVLAECSSMTFYEVDIQAEAWKHMETQKSSTAGDSKPEDTQAAEELDQDEIKRQEARKAMLEENNKKIIASKIIQKHMMIRIMHQRLMKKKYLQFEQEETLKPFSISDTNCGICATGFAHTETEGSQDGKNSQESKSEHCQTDSHIKNQQEYKKFKEKYLQIHPKYQKMKQFISAHRVMEDSSIYEPIKLNITKILNALKDFENTWSELLVSRKWSNQQELFNAFQTLSDKFDLDQRRIQSMYEENKNEANAAGQEQKSTLKEATDQAEEIADVTEFEEQSYNNDRNKKRNYQHRNKGGNSHFRKPQGFDNRNRPFYRNRNREQFNQDLPPRFKKSKYVQQ